MPERKEQRQTKIASFFCLIIVPIRDLISAILIKKFDPHDN